MTGKVQNKMNSMWLILATLSGPGVAILHEYNIFSIGPDATLWPLVSIVLVSGLGIILIIRIAFQQSSRFLWLAMIPNGVILLFYGFLLLFFGLGGCR